MECETIRQRLGEFFDGELTPELCDEVKRHLPKCAACRAELAAIESLAGGLAATANVGLPDGLWMSIDRRLDAKTTRPATRRAMRWRMATAAAIILAVGLGYLTTVLPGTSSTAQARSFDFTPLLNRVGTDLGAGLQALMDAYGGRPITLAQARAEMRVRVHPPEELPDGMRLKSTHMVQMMDHESLAFLFVGPNDQLLVMQCPAGMAKEFGGRECLACQVGERPGEVVREGVWRLFHIESENVCICVVSTMEQGAELTAFLELLHIEY